MFSDEELKALQERAPHSIEITEFLPTDKVDPVYFKKTYYLGPDKGGERAYKLLAQALRKSGRSAIAKYAARGKQYLVLLRPLEDALVMQQLRYADEIRSISDVPLGDARVKPGELKLALQIVDQAVSDTFRPADYEDEVRQRILAQIEKKVDGQEITLESEEEPKAQVIDLLQALKSSLARKAGSRRPAKRSPRKTAGAAGKRAKSSGR